MDAHTYHIYPLGDQALTIQFGDTINEATNKKIMQLFHQLQINPIKGVKDIIPAYASLTICYNYTMTYKANSTAGNFEWMKEQIISHLQSIKEIASNNRFIHIPVCYDFSLAPDLQEISLLLGISVEELIEIHCATTYSVYMIGFLPGFPYMASVDERIRINRKVTPRNVVPKGSVGIAGEQTGIYPLDSPGGWQLIGQTPLNIFDVSKEIPCLLQPGDTIQFNSISLNEFEQIKNEIN